MAITVPVVGNLTTSTGLPAAPVNQAVSYTTNGFSADVTQTQFPLQLGVPMQPIYMFRVIPAEAETGEAGSCVAVAQTLSGSGPFTLTLNTTDTVSVTDPTPLVYTISKAITYNGSAAVKLDCERCLNIYFESTPIVGTVITIQGVDYLGNPMTIINTLSNTDMEITINNPISIITSITFSTNPFSSSGIVHVGNSSNIGLPYILKDWSQVIDVMFDGVVFEADSYSGYVYKGYPWRTSPPQNGLAMNNPTRGFVYVDELGEGDPTGNQVMCITYYVAGADSELDANVRNLNESALGLLGVETTSSGDYALPYIVEPDLIGLQWNNSTTATTGQLPFINAYVDLLVS